MTTDFYILMEVARGLLDDGSQPPVKLPPNLRMPKPHVRVVSLDQFGRPLTREPAYTPRALAELKARRELEAA